MKRSIFSWHLSIAFHNITLSKQLQYTEQGQESKVWGVNEFWETANELTGALTKCEIDFFLEKKHDHQYSDVHLIFEGTIPVFVSPVL